MKNTLRVAYFYFCITSKARVKSPPKLKYPPQITFIALEAANLNEITSSLAIMFFALKQNFTYPYQLF